MPLALYPAHLACLYVPDFRLQASLNQLGGEPEGGLALVDPEDGRRRIVAASPWARLDGVRRGMTAVTATALAPELTVRPVDHAALAIVHGELEEAVRAVTPQLESTGAGVIYASFAGLATRYGADGAGGFLDDLRAAALARELPARVGMASNRFVARCAAVLAPSSGPGLLVPAGQEATFLAPRSIRLLPDALDAVASLERLGVLTLGALAELPAGGIVRRLGPRGALLQRLARGEDRSQLIPSREPRRFARGAHADLPVERLEPLLFLMRGPLSLLLGELDGQGLAAASLDWQLRLEGHPPLEGCVRSAAPSASLRLWSDLLRLDLDRHPLPAGVLAVELEAREVGPHCPDQERMLGPRQAPPGALSRTLAHLATELGRQAFGVLRPRTAVLPEDREQLAEPGRFPLRPPPVDRLPEPWLPPPSPSDEPPVAFRREQPPQPVQVELGRSGIRRVVHRSGRLEVLGTEGPWDVSTGWWDAPVRRRYFQVTGPREVAWLFVEPETRDWFLAGWLD